MPANTGQTDALNTGRFRIIWNGWQPNIKCKRELTRRPPSVWGPGLQPMLPIRITLEIPKVNLTSHPNWILYINSNILLYLLMFSLNDGTAVGICTNLHSEYICFWLYLFLYL